jgi:hypothetical protein
MKLQILNITLFLIILTAGGVAVVLLKKESISIVEKRKLCTFPKLTKTSLFSGSFTDSLDLYVADNFPLREILVESAFLIKDHLGFTHNKVTYYKKSFDQEPVIELASKPDSLTTIVNTDTASKKSELDAGLVIYNNQAFQLFTGVKSAENNYAKMVNSYFKTFGKQLRVFSVVCPMVDEFYLPEEYKAYNPSELKSINSIFNQINDSVGKPDSYSELKTHTQEYLYFNTDHHWTGRGAYYAYSSFCKSADIETKPLSELERKVIPRFLGSLYWLTRNKDLKDNIDSVEYFKSPVKYTATAYKEGLDGTSLKARVYNEGAKGSNAYGIFLGGDYGLFKIKTVNNTNRRALIIKNSYGNPFSTYFLSDFDEIYVVDYRYFKGNLTTLVNDSKITHLVFCTPIMTANTKWHIRKMLNLL